MRLERRSLFSSFLLEKYYGILSVINSVEESDETLSFIGCVELLFMTLLKLYYK